jgi:hypothetical protein
MLLALSAAVMATQDEDLPTEAGAFIDSLTRFGLDRSAAAHLTRRIAAA